MEDFPDGVDPAALLTWFNEQKQETDRQEAVLAAEVEAAPKLADPVASLRRDLRIGEVSGSKKFLQDFKGFLLAQQVLDDDQLRALLEEDL